MVYVKKASGGTRTWSTRKMSSRKEVEQRLGVEERSNDEEGWSLFNGDANLSSFREIRARINN